MRILLLVPFAVFLSCALGDESKGPDVGGPDVGGPDVGGPDGGGPDKHPFQVCLEIYDSCVRNVAEWEDQQKCFLDFYKCQNEYTSECRKLYRNKGCYNLIGKERCWEKLRECYGSKPAGPE